MRVVYLVHDMSHIAGGTRVITEHVNGLSKLGHDVEVWVQNESSKPYFNIEVPVHGLSGKNLSRPDVVVVTGQELLPLVADSRKSKRTVLLLQHDDVWLASVTGNASYRELIPSYYPYFRRGDWQIVTVSRWLADAIEKRHGIICTVIPNGIDTKLFRPSPPLLKPAGLSVLLYSDLQSWKGFELAATAAIEAKRRIPTLDIVIFGAFLPQAVNQDGTGNRFTFPTAFFCTPEQADLARIYSSATVFLSASWQEGFGLPGLEAMACGSAVVTTDNGGSREYAQHLSNAFVVPPMNTNALIDGLVNVLSNSELRHTLITNGKKQAKNMHWDKQIKTLHGFLID